MSCVNLIPHHIQRPLRLLSSLSFLVGGLTGLLVRFSVLVGNGFVGRIGLEVAGLYVMGWLL